MLKVVDLVRSWHGVDVLSDRELTLLRRLHYSIFYCYMYNKGQLCVFFSTLTNNVHYPYTSFARTLYPFSYTSSQVQRPCITYILYVLIPDLASARNMDQAGRRLPHPADFTSVNKCPTPDRFNIIMLKNE